jgi:uracil-DNA glycosylase family 4
MNNLLLRSSTNRQTCVKCFDAHSSENTPTTPTREDAFLHLVERVSDCHTCSRMNGRTRVLGKNNGDLYAKALFIAEAPGRHGADASSIPLYGDQTGRNFDMLLQVCGLRREELFITNAVLCNPRDQEGRNSTPTKREVCNCASHLQMTIEIIQPQYIVTLGNVALQSLHTIEPHSIRLSKDVGMCVEWNGRSLIPLYHPGPRARLHRSLNLQVDDFQKVACLLKA